MRKFHTSHVYSLVPWQMLRRQLLRKMRQMLRDKCSETFASATFAPPTFAPTIAPATFAPPTIAPPTIAPATTAPATDFQELLRGYATFALPIITLKICDIFSADNCQLSRSRASKYGNYPHPAWRAIMGKHIREKKAPPPRLISNGWVARAVWEWGGMHGDGASFRDKSPRLSGKGALRAGSSINAPLRENRGLVSKGCVE